MKQTAVQYFAQKAMTLIISPKEMRDFIKWLEEAKEMEKDQMHEAFKEGYFVHFPSDVDFNNYYQETYENNEKTS